MYIAMECTNHNREQKWNLLDSPNQGKKGECQFKSMKRQLKQLLPEPALSQICYTGRKLKLCFGIKDYTLA